MGWSKIDILSVKCRILIQNIAHICWTSNIWLKQKPQKSISFLSPCVGTVAQTVWLQLRTERMGLGNWLIFLIQKKFFSILPIKPISIQQKFIFIFYCVLHLRYWTLTITRLPLILGFNRTDRFDAVAGHSPLQLHRDRGWLEIWTYPMQRWLLITEWMWMNESLFRGCENV